jgi:hypothetical protein
MGSSDTPSSPVDASGFAYVVGIDIGSQTYSFCAYKPDKSQVIKPTEFANARLGFALLQSRLAQLGVPAEQVLIGLEATSRYVENLYQFAQQRGLRAKTDHLDATTIARLLLSGEARRGYVPSFPSCFQSSPRSLLILVAQPLLPCSSSIPVHQPSRLPAWRSSPPSYMHWLRVTTGVTQLNSWYSLLSSPVAVAWRQQCYMQN